MDHAIEISRIENILGRSLTPDEHAEVVFWRRGRALAQLENTDGAEVALELLGGYADEAAAELIAGTFPRDDELRAAHSRSHAANNQYQKFKDDVARLIGMSRTTPEVVKQAFRQIGPAVPE